MLSIQNVNLDLQEFSLKDISLDVNEGDYLVVMGASGVGKTILLEAIAGLYPLDSGCVRLGQKDITKEKIQKRQVGLVYQDQALFPHLTVLKNIQYGLKAKRLFAKSYQTHLDQIIKDIGLSSILHRKPETLSGGEAQRVALARVLAIQPKLLILDEPLSSLDVTARAEMRRLLRSLNRKGQTIIHVTHDYEEALALASHIAVMEDGKIVQSGPAQDIFQRPKSEFVASFVGMKNFFEGELKNQDQKSQMIFETGDLIISILTDKNAGEGFLALRSEDVIISLEKLNSSALNVFEGTVVEIEASHLGMEVSVDIGKTIVTHVSRESCQKLELTFGKKIWLCFKASACQFIEK